MDLRFVSYDQGIIQNFAARSKHSFHGISSALITDMLLWILITLSVDICIFNMQCQKTEILFSTRE